MGKLFGYFQDNSIDSEGQLRAAQRQTHTPDQEAQARRAGYRNAAEALAFLKQHQAQPQRRELSWYERLMGGNDLTAGHPAKSLQRATHALEDANQ